MQTLEEKGSCGHLNAQPALHEMPFNTEGALSACGKHENILLIRQSVSGKQTFLSQK